MEERNVDKIVEATHYPRMAAAAALGMLAVFLLVATLSELRSYRYIGSGITPSNTISVSGEGEVFAVPDTAQFSFTVTETGADVAAAQKKATAKSNDMIAYLKQQNIDDKYVQTTDYSVNPQYSYSQSVCPSYGYCPPGKQTITGYEVSQTVSVKVHDTTKAGDLLSGIGSRGISNVSGLDFTVGDQKKLEHEARDKAVADAKEKAEDLARALGVSIVRIVAYSENGSSPMPYYAKALATEARDSAAGNVAPSLPVGQNKITSNVSISYEIR